MSIRAPAVADTFYPGDAESLTGAIHDAFSGISAHSSRCVIVPHAGYAYSAHVACHSVRALENTGGPVIIVGPEHACTQRGASVSAAESWRTPLGDVRVDHDAACELARISDDVTIDDAAHDTEHSIEVQVPLLQQAFGSDLRIVPVALSEQDMGIASRIGKALAQVAQSHNAVIVASSDLTHYESDADARRKDAALIECIIRLDVDAMYETLRAMRISACGYGAICACMVAARAMNATCGRLLKYATSGDSENGMRDSVVGYASVMFE